MRKIWKPFTASLCFFLNALKSARDSVPIASLAGTFETLLRDRDMRGNPFDLRAIKVAWMFPELTDVHL